MVFLLRQKCNLSDAYTIVTKPVYVLSLGYSSRQSYKLFKAFKQLWMKDDHNHLASDFITEVCYISELGHIATQDTRYQAQSYPLRCSALPVHTYS